MNAYAALLARSTGFKAIDLSGGGVAAWSLGVPDLGITTLEDVRTALVKAHEIFGVLVLENSFNRVGLDHVILLKIAFTAVVSGLLGATQAQMIIAISNAWVDGQALRPYWHAPNTGSRKS